MTASYSCSLAPGTVANKKKQAQEYLKFSLLYNVHYLFPTVTNVCMFAQLLVNKHSSPSSIKNYISGAKSWVVEHGGSPYAFSSPQLGQLVKGFIKNSTHVPSRAAPLAPRHVRASCDFLDSWSAAPLAAKPAVLLGFTCFLRSSNLLSPTMLEWGGPHTLLAIDLKLSGDSLSVFIRSTKTRSDPKGSFFTIQAAQHPRYCPVSAWRLYKAVVNPWPLGPTFVDSKGLPLTPRQLVGLMRLALEDHNDISAGEVSMHSLR